MYRVGWIGWCALVVGIASLCGDEIVQYEFKHKANEIQRNQLQHELNWNKWVYSELVCPNELCCIHAVFSPTRSQFRFVWAAVDFASRAAEDPVALVDSVPAWLAAVAAAEMKMELYLFGSEPDLPLHMDWSFGKALPSDPAYGWRPFAELPVRTAKPSAAGASVKCKYVYN